MKRLFPAVFTAILLCSCSYPGASSEPEEPDLSGFSDNVDPIFGPGEISVNELAQTFGEPELVYGYFDESGAQIVSVTFQEAMFDLACYDGRLQLEESSDQIQDVPESVLDLELVPETVSITGGDWQLPRNIRLGDSLDTVYSAYGSHGTERTAQGERLISYDLEDGAVTYHFDQEGSLFQFTISWNDRSFPSGTDTGEAPPA
ncbi:MAG: hypothetical protein IJ071_09305 [Ruminococcus sp.]|nr:hypothetical protein [Ruminococcus sp.]